MLTLYAQPYDILAKGFFFESAESYAAQATTKTNHYGLPVEEFEIQVIDGDPLDIALADATQVHQGDIPAIYDAIDRLDDHQKQAAIIALREGLSFSLTEDEPDDLDIDIYPIDSLRELAEQFVDEGLFGDIPERLQFYIDYDAIARDLGMDYTEASIAGERVIYRVG